MQNPARRRLVERRAPRAFFLLAAGHEVHHRLQPLIRGRHTQQKLQNALVDRERRFQQRSRSQLDQPPVAQRLGAAHGAPVRMLQDRERQPEGGRLRSRLHGGNRRAEAPVQRRARQEQDDIQLELAQPEDLAQPAHRLPSCSGKIRERSRQLRRRKHALLLASHAPVHALQLHPQRQRHRLPVGLCEAAFPLRRPARLIDEIHLPAGAHALTSTCGSHCPYVGLPEFVSRRELALRAVHFHAQRIGPHRDAGGHGDRHRCRSRRPVSGQRRLRNRQVPDVNHDRLHDAHRRVHRHRQR